MYSCAGCVFARMDSGTQTGCKLNRLEKLTTLPIAGKNAFLDKNGKIYAITERLCNTARSNAWGTGSVSDIQKVLEEVYPKFTYVIYFKKNLQGLQETLDSLDKPSYVIVMNEDVEYNEEIFEILNNKSIPYNFIQLLEDFTWHRKFDEAFKYCKTTWVVYVKAGYKFAPDFENRINHRINHDMRRFLIAYDEQKEKFVVQSLLFKLLHGNLQFIKEDGTTDSRSFFERLASAEYKDPDCIESWEKFLE